MRLRTRKLLFWTLIPCFLVGGTAIVLYSQGYRVGLSSREVTKVGALYVRGYPRDAVITLDGAPLNTGSWWPLQSGTLAGGLAPGSYRLHAQAPGYRDWDADIAIGATLVTERKSLVLFPDLAQRFAPETGSSTVTRLYPSAGTDGPTLELEGASGTRTRIGSETLPGSFVGMAGNRVVTRLAASERSSSSLLRFAAPGRPTATNVSAPGEDLGTFDDAALVRESGRLVVAYDAVTGARSVVASSSATSSVGAVLRTREHDAWVTGVPDGSLLHVIRRGSADESREIPLPGILSLQAAGDRIGALDTNGSLWLIEPDSGALREIGHRAGFASWNPDGSSVLALIDGRLEVIPLRDGVPHGVLANLRADATARIGQVAWYPDGEHLFVDIGEDLVFADIINGSPAEAHAYRLPAPRSWSFDAGSRTLYVLSEDGRVLAYAFPS